MVSCWSADSKSMKHTYTAHGNVRGESRIARLGGGAYSDMWSIARSDGEDMVSLLDSNGDHEAWVTGTEADRIFGGGE